MKKSRPAGDDPGTEECLRMARLCLSASLRRTERLVTRHYDEHLASSGVTAVQLPMLAVIAASEHPTFRLLSERLHLDRSTLSRNLAVLTQKRLVSVAPSAGPKAGRISLTVKGRTALRNAHGRWMEAHRALEHALSGDGLSDALDMLRSLRRAVRTVAD